MKFQHMERVRLLGDDLDRVGSVVLCYDEGSVVVRWDMYDFDCCYDEDELEHVTH